MKELNIISAEMKNAVGNRNPSGIDEQLEKCHLFLIENFTNPSLKKLNSVNLKELAYCLIVMEYEWLHKNKNGDIIFIIKDICTSYSELALMKSRIECLRYPDMINHIERDWKVVLEKCLIQLFIISNNTEDSLLLNNTGKETFLNRCGIKIMGQICTLLKRVNAQEKLPLLTMEIMKEISKDNNDLVRALNWTTQTNDNHEFGHDLLVS
jgi:hypothetical protein